jgi:hypothetical protein
MERKNRWTPSEPPLEPCDKKYEEKSLLGPLSTKLGVGLATEGESGRNKKSLPSRA